MGDLEHSVWFTTVGSAGVITGLGSTSIVNWIEVSEQTAPTVTKVAVNIVGTTTVSLIWPTISNSRIDPLADVERVKPLGSVPEPTIKFPAFWILKVVKGVGLKKEEPLQIELDPTLLAIPDITEIVAGASISIVPVELTTAQFAAGATVVIT